MAIATTLQLHLEQSLLVDKTTNTTTTMASSTSTTADMATIAAVSTTMARVTISTIAAITTPSTTTYVSPCGPRPADGLGHPNPSSEAAMHSGIACGAKRSLIEIALRFRTKSFCPFRWARQRKHNKHITTVFCITLEKIV